MLFKALEYTNVFDGRRCGSSTEFCLPCRHVLLPGIDTHSKSHCWVVISSVSKNCFIALLVRAYESNPEKPINSTLTTYGLIQPCCNDKYKRQNKKGKRKTAENKMLTTVVNCRASELWDWRIRLETKKIGNERRSKQDGTMMGLSVAG